MRVSREGLQPGKYVVHKANHFEGFQLWTDGTCIRRPTNKRHIGTVQDYHDEILQSNEAVFQLVPHNGNLPEQTDAEDVCGGSVSRTPSPRSLADPTESMEVLAIRTDPNVLVGWVVWGGAPPHYMPVNASGNCMLPNFVDARCAAHWFLGVGLPSLPHPWMQQILSLPSCIRAEVWLTLSFSSFCDIGARAKVYLAGILGLLHLQVPVHQFPEEVLQLYKYVWPKACLKEILCRLGYEVHTPYQELQCLATVNEELQSRSLPRALLFPWPCARLVFPGVYIVQFYGAFSALKGSSDGTYWFCGDSYARVPPQSVTDLRSLEPVTVHRLHHCAEHTDVVLEDVEGGSCNNHMVQLHWACSSAEICHVSIEDTCVLAQVRSTLAPKLTCSVYCIEVLCDGRVLQAQDSWQDLGEPASFDIVLLSPTHDYSSELLAAVREGDDDGVHEIVRRRQSLQIFWNEENDNLLIYTCLFQFSEQVACTLIASGVSVNTHYQGYSALHYCIQAGWVVAGKAMVEKGASLRSTDHTGKTCLHHAGWFQHVDCVQWLLSEGLDPLMEDLRGDTPFSLARESPSCTLCLVKASEHQLGWKHILVRSLESLHGFLSWQDCACLFAATECLGKQKPYFCDELDALGGASDAGVVQPGGESVEVRRAHRNAATLVVVMEALWKEHFWCLLPAHALCQARAANKSLRTVLADVEAAWDDLLRNILDTPFWGILTEGIQVPGIQGNLVPRVRWDFAQCASWEEMWFSDAQIFALSGRTLTRWKDANVNRTYTVQYLAERTRRAGKRVQLTQESETLWCELTEFVFQLEYGAARAWLSFLHMKDVVQSTSDESSDFDSDVSGGGVPCTDVLPQVGDRALAMKEEWLRKIMSGEKTLELRNKSTQPGLAWFSAQNRIYLRANIVRTELLTGESFHKHRGKHCWAGEPPYETTWGGGWKTSSNCHNPSLSKNFVVPSLGQL